MQNGNHITVQVKWSFKSVTTYLNLSYTSYSVKVMTLTVQFGTAIPNMRLVVSPGFCNHKAVTWSIVISSQLSATEKSTEQWLQGDRYWKIQYTFLWCVIKTLTETDIGKVTQRIQNILAKHHKGSCFIPFKIQLMVKITNWNGGSFKIFGSFFSCT